MVSPLLVVAQSCPCCCWLVLSLLLINPLPLHVVDDHSSLCCWSVLSVLLISPLPVVDHSSPCWSVLSLLLISPLPVVDDQSSPCCWSVLSLLLINPLHLCVVDDQSSPCCWWSILSLLLVCRHHGWVQQIRWPGWRPEVHPHRNHLCHHHHLLCLYPSQSFCCPAAHRSESGSRKSQAAPSSSWYMYIREFVVTTLFHSGLLNQRWAHAINSSQLGCCGNTVVAVCWFFCFVWEREIECVYVCVSVWRYFLPICLQLSVTLLLCTLWQKCDFHINLHTATHTDTGKKDACTLLRPYSFHAIDLKNNRFWVIEVCNLVTSKILYEQFLPVADQFFLCTQQIWQVFYSSLEPLKGMSWETSEYCLPH